MNRDIAQGDLEPRLLMWDMRRRIQWDAVPARRMVVRFEFRGAKRDSIWLVLERREASVCFHDPELEVDLFVTADTLALHRVWMGHCSMADALRGRLIEVEGPSELARAFPSWLAMSSFAGIAPAAAGTP